MVEKADIDREAIGDTIMGLDTNSESNFWYSTGDGEWKPLGCFVFETSLPVELTDEDIAKISRILLPLGELEIVPRDEE